MPTTAIGSHPVEGSRVAGSLTVGGPFSSWPSPDAWLSQAAERFERWDPNAALGLSAVDLKEVVSDMAPPPEWLWHPSIQAIDAAGDVRLERLRLDAQLAVWIASHSDRELGSLLLAAPTMLWFPTGSEELGVGRHQLRALGAKMRQPALSGIGIDVWCDTIPNPLTFSWAASRPTDDAQVAELERQLRRFLVTVDWLREHMRDCFDWIAVVAKVVVPLRGGGAQFRSGSSPDLPAMVQLDLMNELHILEGLVHESAHLHLFRAEGAAPLVKPGDDGLFPSPLRPEPRPLRGIFLAYHALAYICLFYGNLLRIAGNATEQLAPQYSDLRVKTQDAERVLLAERQRLTPQGKELLDRTRAELGACYA